MIELNFMTALVIGLTGAGHCISMCGGIAAAVTMGMPNKPQQQWVYLLCYNLGRISAYMVAGLIVSQAVAEVAELAGTNIVLISLRIVASIMIIILGLYIGNWWSGLIYIERVGHYLWRYIAPITQYFLPLTSPLKAIPFGFLWGWLPCGLVYSTLTWAAVSGSAINGMVIMFAFGLGTLPAMLAVGAIADKLKTLLKNSYFKRANALFIIIYGVHTGYIAINQI
ncbi:cytochrome biogenesis protein [Photobacterium aquimaris]|uniref:Sulfite exporter TauE/SafE family protein n=1 Tax=Photobacterium aquimaris TaxID=512643 RepID=A0A2T3ILH5_9GAMM|nr:MULTISPECIES: sulfite exporter TauE/SafE family protein [Photobacterium]OBU12837.1 cytochrome biogenesis protein [Photobacterium aquimaris]OBU22409.1 cytochrome biogenesis protein [Photobacterium aquimaris]PSU29158.1 sulfite exporter TauE/SafE family protein [Photobacterium aquimaris]PSW00779.1 sulfite exporter TauE/SafE family protein [Photobacterium aquimaris]